MIDLKQFIRYAFVGGIAALAEWGTFALCGRLHYALATILAFLFATLVNFVLARRFVFEKKTAPKAGREIIAVYLASAVGLLFNLLLMYCFVEKLHLQPLFSKIIATGIAFFWNFFSRKFMIYRP